MMAEITKNWKLISMFAIAAVVILAGCSVYLLVDRNKQARNYQIEKTNYRKYKATLNSKLEAISKRNGVIDSLKKERDDAIKRLNFKEQNSNISNKYKQLGNEMDASTVDEYVRNAERLHAINDTLVLEREQ